MSGVLVLLVVTSVAFAVTNVDGLLVLLAFFSDRRYATVQVVVGQYLGMSVLIVAAVIGSLLSLVIPPPRLGLIGFLPLAAGAWQAFVARGAAGTIGTDESRYLKPISVALVTVSNGGDNLGTYVPLFSAMTSGQLQITIAVFSLLTGLWCAVAYWFVHHSRLALPIRRHGGQARPWVLMALGVFILIRTNAIAEL
ncbi:MAG: quaternary ammonium transporter [Rhodospirillales bacterium]|jgi:cadmium resistance protein CadD (predicted permease)|nr:quaternary ammonium transporter [Rhodospirillales bacterium]